MFLYSFMFPVAGGLVKKILETKKELEGGSLTQQGKAAKKTEIVSHLHLTGVIKSYIFPIFPYILYTFIYFSKISMF